MSLWLMSYLKLVQTYMYIYTFSARIVYTTTIYSCANEQSYCNHKKVGKYDTAYMSAQN